MSDSENFGTGITPDTSTADSDGGMSGTMIAAEMILDATETVARRREREQQAFLMKAVMLSLDVTELVIDTSMLTEDERTIELSEPSPGRYLFRLV